MRTALVRAIELAIGLAHQRIAIDRRAARQRQRRVESKQLPGRDYADRTCADGTRLGAPLRTKFASMRAVATPVRFSFPSQKGVS